jgi:hypothetical protein
MDILRQSHVSESLGIPGTDCRRLGDTGYHPSFLVITHSADRLVHAFAGRCVYASAVIS